MCKISIIIPTFNRCEILKRTISSILSQTFTDYELIIVSNGSSDNTEEMIKQYNDPRIRFFHQKGSGSPAAPRNHGIRKAKGEYVAFCDDDDLWEKTKLAQQIELLDTHLNYGVCYTKMKRFSFESDWIDPNEEDDKPLDSKSLLLKNTVPLSSVMIRKNILDKVEYFDESKAIAGAEDYELMLRLSKITSFACLPQYLTLYYSGNNRFTVMVKNSYIRNIKYFIRLFFVYKSLVNKGIFGWREVLYPLFVSFIQVSKILIYDFKTSLRKRV